MKNLFICTLGFPKTGQGKEEARIGENERKIWNQQRQVKKERDLHIGYISWIHSIE